MKRRLLRWGLLALLVVGAATAIRWLRRDNERIRGDLAQAERREQTLAGLRAAMDCSR